MQVNNYSQSRSNLSFGKVIKLRVYIDGLPTLDENRIGKATRGLVKILQKQDTRHPKADTFIKTFRENVYDYSVPVEKVDSKYPIIRNLINEVSQFLFTGHQTEELNPLAKQIGIVKHNGLAQIGTTKTYETKLSTNKYFTKAKSFINNPNLRLREAKPPREEVELRIYTKGKGKPESRNFKLEIDEIMFRKPNESKVRMSQDSLF